MSESLQTAWFYTRGGERIGPVTFGELKTHVSQGVLNPRLDMAWTQGMENWMPTGEIEGLFERRAAVPEPQRESLAPPADPYKPPERAEVSESELGKDSGWPGTRRRGYIFMCMIFPIAWSAAMAAGTGFLQEFVGPQLIMVVQPVAGLIPFIAGLIFCLKRFVNLGMSRWWWLGFFVPILGFWVGYRCFACPAGYAVHKKLDGVGIFLAIIYWLFIAAILIGIVLLVVVLAGSLGSPEIKQQIEEALRAATAPAPQP